MNRRLGPGDVAPDDLDAPFWDACRGHRFLVHRCTTCGRAYWPASCCVEHGSAPMQWEEATGRGVVHTYTVVHHRYDPASSAALPYVLAVVRLDEGPFFHTDVVGCDPGAVHVGLRVEMVYERLDDGAVIPHAVPERPTGEELP